MKTSERHSKDASKRDASLERQIKLDAISYHHIIPHPLSVKVYGKPKPSADFLASIEKVGLLQPLIVNETEDGRRQLLAGSTRQEAWHILYKQKRVKSDRILCRIVRLSPLEAERQVIESNRQRVKTKAQVAREASELLRIEKALGLQRMKAGKANPREKLPEGRARDVVGKVLGVSGKTVEKMAAVAEKADAGIPAARAAMEALDKNKISVDAAYKEVVKPKPSKDPALVTAVQAHEKMARDLTAERMTDEMREIEEFDRPEGTEPKRTRAQYTIILTVEGTRFDAVQKSAKLAFGDDLRSVEKVNHSASRQARLDDAMGSIEEAKDEIEEPRDEIQDILDNTPENLQGSEKYSEREQCVEALDEFLQNLESLDASDIEFPGMN